MKKIFIGIDVSKETLDVTMIISSEDGFTVSSEAYVKVGNSAKGFSQAVSFVRKNAKKTPSEQWLFCCETTGGYDNKLCQYLYKQGGKNGADCYSKNGHAVTILTRQS